MKPVKIDLIDFVEINKKHISSDVFLFVAHALEAPHRWSILGSKIVDLFEQGTEKK